MKQLMFVVISAAIMTVFAACSPTPVAIKFDKDVYVLEGADAKGKIVAFAVDADGNPIKEGVDLTYFCADRDVVKVSADGSIEAVSSGEETVEVEVVGVDIKAEIDIRVKIPSGIEVTHEKLSLWVGQVKKNVAAWVVSEKEAYIEGYTTEWTSNDPSIVSVKGIPDPVKGKMQRSYVEMKGLKSGDTTITASFGDLSKDITVRVYREDEELDLSGRRKQPADGEEKEEEEEEEEE
ncbi:MAG: hypothetical protein JXX29_08320 [Deltaproteobacteria bacterium]|nr:hypothetical protein [Deltaproteobacteria bacterium]MBN2671665.1 hypothetical protein [Deltaproteobacteria bacterium]